MKLFQTVAGWSLMGGILGYVLVHPGVMLLAELMGSHPSIGMRPPAEPIWTDVMSAFSPSMLPWSLSFGVTGMAAGYFLGKSRQAIRAIRENERLQGVLEMAGATCHELGQPLQVISGFTEILEAKIAAGVPLADELDMIRRNQDLMMDKIRRIRMITRYAASDYIKGIRIVDIDKASSGDPIPCCKES